MNYNLLFPSPAKRLLEEQLSNYIRRHLEEKRKRQRAVCIQNVEGLRLVHHLPDPWSSSEPATGCCLLPLWETATSAVEGCHQADISYSFMNDLVSILAARNNFSFTDLAESAGTAPCLLAAVSFNSPFWCFPFGEGGQLWTREESFSSDWVL